MEYQVPQFIEVEDKIFGPLTLKQFIFVAGGIGMCVVVFLYTPLFLAVLIDIPIGAFTAALAFYKVNNKTFLDMLEAGFNFYTKGKLFLWKKNAPSEVPQSVRVAEPEVRQKLGISENRLKELAWSLDIKDQQGQSNVS